MLDPRWEHCNQRDVYERMIVIRDRLGDFVAGGRYASELTEDEKGDIARLFQGDRTLFAFMDETPGDFLVNGRPPAGERHGGTGYYYDGKGRQGWHTLLRQLRNEPGDDFWGPFNEERESVA
jgi:hypothetical protein